MRRKIDRSVNERDDDDAVVLNLVHQSIAKDEHLPNLEVVRLRNDTSTFGKGRQRGASLQCLLEYMNRGFGRIL